MVRLEDTLVTKLEDRLNYLKTVSKKVKDKQVLTNYFESRVHRSILDYLLQKELFDTADTLAKELHLQAFSDIHTFKEVFEVINKLKAVSGALADNQKTDKFPKGLVESAH